jgi:hypothetical protein
MAASAFPSSFKLRFWACPPDPMGGELPEPRRLTRVLSFGCGVTRRRCASPWATSTHHAIGRPPRSSAAAGHRGSSPAEARTHAAGAQARQVLRLLHPRRRFLQVVFLCYSPASIHVTRLCGGFSLTIM